MKIEGFPHWIASRGLSREQAAVYVGVSPSTFDKMVKGGTMPIPKRVGARTIWDRTRLDEAFEALPDEGTDAGDNPWRKAFAK